MDSHEYYISNKDSIIAKNAAYQRNKRAECTARQKRWKLAHPDKVAQYRAAEKLKFKADLVKVQQHNKKNLNNYHKTRASIFDILGKECKRCGFSDQRALQIDHIYGGGNKQRIRVNSLMYFREILADPNIHEKYQVLCANCNWIKRAENNENSNPRKH